MITSLDEACWYVAKKGLVVASSGNMSQRASDSLMRITLSGVWFEFMDGHSTPCSFDQRAEGASSEWMMHALIYRARPDVGVVLHCQSPYATALACDVEDPVNTLRRFRTIPELSYYINKYGMVDSFSPGSDTLAQDTAKVLTDPDFNVAILKDHGQVVVGKDFDDVIQKALFFELACQTIYIRRICESGRGLSAGFGAS